MSPVPPYSGWIETTGDALIILEAASARRNLIPRITRRLVDNERSMIVSGSVFVFDEEESGIKRWTDGYYWSPSRILGNFLVYRETDKKGASHGAKKRKQEDIDSDEGDGESLSRPKNEVVPGVDRTQERILMGSLTNSLKFKKDGLMKKTLSMTINGITHHLISYYKIADVTAGRLRAPSTLPELASLDINPSFLDKANFRCPPKIELDIDGQPRYRGEADEVLAQGMDLGLGVGVSSMPLSRSTSNGKGRRDVKGKGREMDGVEEDTKPVILKKTTNTGGMGPPSPRILRRPPSSPETKLIPPASSSTAIPPLLSPTRSSSSRKRDRKDIVEDDRSPTPTTATLKRTKVEAVDAHALSVAIPMAQVNVSPSSSSVMNSTTHSDGTSNPTLLMTPTTSSSLMSSSSLAAAAAAYTEAYQQTRVGQSQQGSLVHSAAVSPTASSSAQPHHSSSLPTTPATATTSTTATGYGGWYYPSQTQSPLSFTGLSNSISHGTSSSSRSESWTPLPPAMPTSRYSLAAYHTPFSPSTAASSSSLDSALLPTRLSTMDPDAPRHLPYLASVPLPPAAAQTQRQRQSYIRASGRRYDDDYAFGGG
ncbi:Gti1/Pac2 family-domain-containing protein [Mycena amicta]|nr:Gti1/Pac2 family-domain-containing protein [Mycena amicta]